MTTEAKPPPHWFTIFNVIVGLALMLVLPIAIGIRSFGFSDLASWTGGYLGALGLAVVAFHILRRKLGPRHAVYRLRNTLFVGSIGAVYVLLLTFLFGLGLAFLGLPPTNWNFILVFPVALAITIIFIRAYYDRLIAALPRFPDE